MFGDHANVLLPGSFGLTDDLVIMAFGLPVVLIYSALVLASNLSVVIVNSPLVLSVYPIDFSVVVPDPSLKIAVGHRLRPLNC
ncbi:hypothetical protein BKG85_02785 [Mycobacteroides chelonae]|nr:hypothetical protein BKG85_02785 [Mycobacteroides chelonae]